MKRGQVTIFVIVAILIVAVIALFFVFRGKLSIGSGVNLEEQEMHSVIESCVLESLVDGVKLIGLQGGYLEVPENAENE